VSGILIATTLFPDLNVIAVAGYLGLASLVFAVAAGPALRWLARRQPAPPPAKFPARGVDRNTWRMPPLTLLEPVTWSPGIRFGMIALRTYLITAVVLLIVKAVQLSGR
jgi:hypothetical protein